MTDPREIEELIGVAFSAHNLRSQPDVERALDRVAAFGVAALRTALRAHPGSTAEVEALLGVQLWHAVQRDPVAERHAAGLLALALVMRGHVEQARAVADRVVWEWLHRQCPACGGTGQQEVVGQRRVKPRALSRNARLVTCYACGGGCAARTDQGARRRAVGGVGMEQYREKWEAVYRLAMGLCDRAAGGLRGPSWRALRGRRNA